MPRVKIDHVENQASNLLSWEVSKKRWLCSQGEPSCSVVLQLARAVKISSVQIGAHHTALVEVLVGRSETPNEPFQVVVPRSVFLSPAQSRGTAGSAGPDRVRSFGEGALTALATQQRWDRLRVVCSQPYNRHCKYGISFIHIFEPEGEPVPAAVPAVPARVFALDTFSSDEEDFRPGELFAKYRQSGGDTGAQIRQATSQALRNNPSAATQLVKTSLGKHGAGTGATTSTTSPGAAPRGPQRDHDNLCYTEEDERPHHRIDHIVRRHNDDKTKQPNTPKHKEKPGETEKVDKTPRSATEEPSPSTTSVVKRDKDGRSEKDDSKTHAHRNGDSSRKNNYENKKRPHFGRDRAEAGDSGEADEADEAEGGLRPGPECEQPLRGVVFVLSGYLNPHRARLRELGVSLGARYQCDWGPACTHLICAFNNTPKLLEVRASACGASVPVPSAAWLEQSGRARRLLPWQWFAAEAERRVPPPHHLPPPPPSPRSDCDTDDDIEEVVRGGKRARTSPSGAEDGDEVEFVKDERMQGNVTVEESESGGDTDVEERERGVERVRARGALPPLFHGLVFLLHAALTAPLDATLLARYCVAYAGLVLAPSEVEADSTASCLVLCGSACSPRSPRQGAGLQLPPRVQARRLRADWVWTCHARRTLLPMDDYLLDD